MSGGSDRTRQTSRSKGLAEDHGRDPLAPVRLRDDDPVQVQEPVAVGVGEPLELQAVVRGAGGEGEDEGGDRPVHLDHGRMGGDQP